MLLHKNRYHDEAVPAGLAAKTLSSQRRGPGFDPWSVSEIPHAATKSWHRQINRFFFLKLLPCHHTWDFTGAPVIKNLPAMPEMQEMLVQSLGRENPLEKAMATHSSILAWRIPTDREAWQGYS